MVKIDGYDVRGLDKKSIASRSASAQGTLLFHAPVWQNIAYGKPEASRSETFALPRLPWPTSSLTKCRKATTP